METYNVSKITKLLYESASHLFSLNTLKQTIGITNRSSLYALIRRLIKADIIEKLERGKYQLTDKPINDFELAQFLYNPSYISFETALNLYGILSQFPYEITSATIKKSKEKRIHTKSFRYVRLKKNLFWGYERRENYLIAHPEKALLDQIYIARKGLKSISLDEYDLTKINKALFIAYNKQFGDSRLPNNYITKILDLI